MAFLHAVLSIRFKVDQIISGTVINILAAGSTRFLNIRILEPAGLSNPGSFSNIAIPVLSEIPIIGPLLFINQPTVYIMLILLVAVNYLIFFTPWGLRMRACGEHPSSADTVGVHVNRTRYISVVIGGLIAGMIAGAAMAGWLEMGRLNVFWGGVLGLAAALATMAGDLWESALKRRFGVKDAGNIIPGHGGLLDRVDGLMFAVVVVAAGRVIVLMLGQGG